MTTIEVEETYTETKTVTEDVTVCEHCAKDDSDEAQQERGPMLSYPGNGDAPDLNFHVDCLEEVGLADEVDYHATPTGPVSVGENWIQEDGEWFRVRTETVEKAKPAALAAAATLSGVLGLALPFLFEGMFTWPLSPFPVVFSYLGGLIAWGLFGMGVLLALTVLVGILKPT